MLEQREFTPGELLAWCRLLIAALAGTGLAYAREREGTSEAFVDFAAGRLSALWAGQAGAGIEAAALGLTLSVEAVAGEVRSRATSPEAAEVVAPDLPSQAAADDLLSWFDVDLSPEALLAVLGVDRDEMNRIYDILTRAIAARALEAAREPGPDNGTQRLTLRVW